MNAEADTAADLGRRHQSEMLIDARRRLLRARSHWYPIMLDLHRFMIAVARVSVNHDCKGGTAPDPLVWDQGSKPKVRPYSVGILISLTYFLNTLHWPSGASDFGHFGVSFLELLILFEQWAGHRLLSEKVWLSVY